jgi:hypothetical protein
VIRLDTSIPKSSFGSKGEEGVAMAKNSLPRKPSTLWDEITENKITFFSVLGSVASIAALIITLLDKIALGENLPPQLAAWRFILLLICLLCIASAAIVSYHWAATMFSDTRLSFHTRLLWATVRAVVGILIIGIFLDGLYAALYWKVWLIPMIRELIALTQRTL